MSGSPAFFLVLLHSSCIPLGSFVLPKEFVEFFSSSVKNAISILVKVALNL